MVKKDVRVVGGVGDLWSKTQYHQQDRVYDTNMCCAAVNAGGINGLYIRKMRYEKNRNKTSG